ncbi:hypothetical protein ABZ705_27470 [Streptomyces sp. NPDC006984]|uniref:hypothetical protein n=1 Tax=Streptomyces sp. NPDC006984 TaxID=3155463 RepID=UPI0033DAD454
MTTDETGRFVRLRVDLVLEIEDLRALTGAALERIAADPLLHDDERAHAESAVREDGAEALASLVDPFDLLSEVPGVELTQASWSSEAVAYDPDALEWDLDDDTADDEDDDEDDGEDGERDDRAGEGAR